MEIVVGNLCNQNPSNGLVECVEIDIHYLSNDSLLENFYIGDEKHLDYMLETVGKSAFCNLELKSILAALIHTLSYHQ